MFAHIYAVTNRCGIAYVYAIPHGYVVVYTCTIVNFVFNLFLRFDFSQTCNWACSCFVFKLVTGLLIMHGEKPIERKLLRDFSSIMDDLVDQN
jgi:hypothetical protein